MSGTTFIWEVLEKETRRCCFGSCSSCLSRTEVEVGFVFVGVEAFDGECACSLRRKGKSTIRFVIFERRRAGVGGWSWIVLMMHDGLFCVCHPLTSRPNAPAVPIRASADMHALTTTSVIRAGQGAHSTVTGKETLVTVE